MKKLIASLLCLFAVLTKGQSTTSLRLDTFEHHYFFNLSASTYNKLIIFLHGGVSNPYFKQHVGNISANYLVENNKQFIDMASQHHFDLIMPIVNDSLNWLTQPQKAFIIIDKYLQSIGKKYDEIYISGFSDGGTGSYKIFYMHPDYFKGLIVFNGYPQHAIFYKKVDYTAVKHKTIIFLSSKEDKTIPYEFLLTEYHTQKLINANTYFYLAEGGHRFSNFHHEYLVNVFMILNHQVNNTMVEPHHGFVKNDVMITHYPFRKKIVRKYNFGRVTYEENQRQLKMLKSKNR